MNITKVLRTISAILLIFPGLTFAAEYDLSGLWQDDNGTTYRVRQLKNNLYWSMDGRPAYANVFVGTINGRTISGSWVDVPGGTRPLGDGKLTLRIETEDRLVKIGQVGNYGADVWTRQGSGATSWESYLKGTGPLVFHLEELGGWTATWTQRPGYDLPGGLWSSPMFDERAVSGNQTMEKVLNIGFDGNKVTAVHEFADDGVKCKFTGEIAVRNNEVWVSGKYRCGVGALQDWRARIDRD